MQSITPTLEKTLLNFASFASILGRAEYAEVLRKTLLLPENERVEQLEILKYSISEILTLSEDNIEFKEFVRKYDLSAENIKEFLRYLGPDSGLKYYPDESTDVHLTLTSFLKSKIDERLYDKVSLLLKLSYGKTYWEDLEYSQIDTNKLNDLLEKIYHKSPKLAQYLYEHVK